MDTVLDILKTAKELTPISVLALGVIGFLVILWKGVPYVINRIEAMIIALVKKMDETNEKNALAFKEANEKQITHHNLVIDKLISSWREEARDFKAEIRSLVKR